jgi:hypothetical protein
MKQLILILSILSLLLFGAWGCSEKTEQAAKTVEEKTTNNVETAQAGTVQTTEVAKEKAKKVIEELQATTPGSTEETKGSE